MGEYFVENLFFIILALSILSFVFLKLGSKIIKLVARGAFSVASIFILNILLSPLNISVGINALTGLLATLLRFPAVVLMFGLALLFRQEKKCLL